VDPQQRDENDNEADLSLSLREQEAKEDYSAGVNDGVDVAIDAAFQAAIEASFDIQYFLIDAILSHLCFSKKQESMAAPGIYTSSGWKATSMLCDSSGNNFEHRHTIQSENSSRSISFSTYPIFQMFGLAERVHVTV